MAARSPTSSPDSRPRYLEVHRVIADSRRFAEDWTHRLLTTALADASDLSPNG
jgi:hypothetical protein